MSKVKGWPKWITVKYFVDLTGNATDQSIKGYRCSVSNKFDLVDKFQRHNLHKDNIVDLIVNDEILNIEKKKKFFKWLDEVKKEVEEYEARKKADSKAETVVK
jgi:hypothetical protein